MAPFYIPGLELLINGLDNERSKLNAMNTSECTNLTVLTLPSVSIKFRIGLNIKFYEIFAKQDVY